MSPLAVARAVNIHVARACIHVTQSNGRQVSVRHPCERLVVSPGDSNHQECQFLEGCLDLVSEVSRSEVAAIGVAPGAAANVSAAHWPVSWMIGH